MVTNFKMQIYPNDKQEQQLFEWCKISHNAWNFLVEKYNDNYPKLSKFGIKDYKENQLMEDMNIIGTPKRIFRGVLKSFSIAVSCYYKKIKK